MNLSQCINPDTQRIDKSRAPTGPVFVWHGFVWRGSDSVEQPVFTVLPPEKRRRKAAHGLPAPGTTLRRVYDWLLDHPGAQSAEVAVGCKISRRTIGGWMCELRNRGLVQSEGRKYKLMWTAVPITESKHEHT